MRDRNIKAVEAKEEAIVEEDGNWWF